MAGHGAKEIEEAARRRGGDSERRRHGHVLTPGRYVGAEPQPEDSEPFEAKMRRLVAELQEQQTEGTRLDDAIAANLKAMGFGGDE